MKRIVPKGAQRNWLLIAAFLLVGILGVVLYRVFVFQEPKALELPHSSLSTLQQVMESLVQRKGEVVMDGNRYSLKEIYSWAQAYLRAHYHAEDPELWVRKHTYRSKQGNIIYYLEEGSQRPLRDVLLEELEKLKDSKGE